jgi:hypothetical protein
MDVVVSMRAGGGVTSVVTFAALAPLALLSSKTKGVLTAIRYAHLAADPLRHAAKRVATEIAGALNRRRERNVASAQGHVITHPLAVSPKV